MSWEWLKKKIVELAGTPILLIAAFIALMALIFVPFIMRFFK
jgi:hypothetical protein